MKPDSTDDNYYSFLLQAADAARADTRPALSAREAARHMYQIRKRLGEKLNSALEAKALDDHNPQRTPKPDGA
jgi:hypothetical protein